MLTRRRWIFVSLSSYIDEPTGARGYVRLPSRAERGESAGAEALQLLERIRKVREELLLVLGVHVHVLLKLGILDERDVARQHHELAAGILVLELGRLVVGRPLQALEQDEVAVVEEQRGSRPRADVPGGVGVASTERVRTRERDDLLVVDCAAFVDRRLGETRG